MEVKMVLTPDDLGRKSTGTALHPQAGSGKSGFLQFPDSPHTVLSSCFPTS